MYEARYITKFRGNVIFGSVGAANPNVMANIQAQLFQEHGISSPSDLKSSDVIYTLLAPASHIHPPAPSTQHQACTYLQALWVIIWPLEERILIFTAYLESSEFPIGFL